MRPDTVVGYQFKADDYCTEYECIVRAVLSSRGLEGHGLSYITSEALERIAISEGIDWQDEKTYDSGDFPKVLFADQVNRHPAEGFSDGGTPYSDEELSYRCVNCGKELGSES